MPDPQAESFKINNRKSFSFTERQVAFQSVASIPYPGGLAMVSPQDPFKICFSVCYNLVVSWLQAPLSFKTRCFGVSLLSGRS